MQRYGQDIEYDMTNIIKRDDGPYVLYIDAIADKEAAKALSELKENFETMSRTAGLQAEMIAEKDKEILGWMAKGLTLGEEREKLKEEIAVLKIELTQNKQWVSDLEQECANYPKLDKQKLVEEIVKLKEQIEAVMYDTVQGEIIKMQKEEITTLRAKIEEIREIWAGSEIGEPVTAQERYAIWLCKQMYGVTIEALKEADHEWQEP